MGGDEHANASLGFARTPTRHALMETSVNDLNAPSSAAKLASFKGRYVSHARHRRTPEPLRRARRTPRVSRVRDWALKKAFFSVGVCSHLSFSSRNVFSLSFSRVLVLARSADGDDDDGARRSSRCVEPSLLLGTRERSLRVSVERLRRMDRRPRRSQRATTGVCRR